MSGELHKIYHVGQRLSLKSELCTVRYIGPVTNRAGEYLGVEWDDPTRGKHAGSYDGVAYFKCQSRSPTVASFLKPGQPWDTPRTFLEALRDKYMADEDGSSSQKVFFTGKEAEQIGFGKFAQRQKRLLGIHVLVLDGMRIRHRSDDDGLEILPDLCAEITDLDLTSNLFESSDEIFDLLQRLPKLSTLTLDRNRFSVGEPTKICFAEIRNLNMRNCLLAHDDISSLVSRLTSVANLSLANNEFNSALSLTLPISVTSLDFTDNELTSISDIQSVIAGKDRIVSLVLKRNKISDVDPNMLLWSNATNLDLSYNRISSWLFFNDLGKAFPGLRHLRVTGNPLYENLVSAEGRPLVAEDGYMLTIARFPMLETLNYSKITEKERLNGETYYLNQIAAELSSVDEALAPGILAKHPRYQALCEEYGEPVIQKRTKPTEIDPNSLAARLVKASFRLAPTLLPRIKKREWTAMLPKSFSIYAILGTVAKHLDTALDGLTPLDLKLVLESDEDILASRDSAYTGPEWWDSDEEEDTEAFTVSSADEWTKRETELIAGTRILATYVDGREATIRIEAASLNRR